MVAQAKKKEVSVNIKETLRDLDQELVLLHDFLQSEVNQRGNRKFFIVIGKNGEIPIIQAGILFQLYEFD